MSTSSQLKEMDLMTIRISRFSLIFNEKLNDSPVFEAILVLNNILDIFSLYENYVGPTNLNVKVINPSKLNVDIMIDRFEILCATEMKVFSVIFDGITIKKYSGIEKLTLISKNIERDDKGKVLDVIEDKREIIEERSVINIKRIQVEFGTSLFGIMTGTNLFSKKVKFM